MTIRFAKLRVTLTLNGEPWTWTEDDLDLEEEPEVTQGFDLSFVIEPEPRPE